MAAKKKLRKSKHYGVVSTQGVSTVKDSPKPGLPADALVASAVNAAKDGYVLDYVSGQQVRATPEEIDAVQVFSRMLVEDFGYPKTHIQTRPQWRVKARPSDEKKEYPVDIAVFNTTSRSDGDEVIVIKCKKKNRKDGKKQLEDYLRF